MPILDIDACIPKIVIAIVNSLECDREHMGRSTYAAQNAPGSRDVRDSNESGTATKLGLRPATRMRRFPHTGRSMSLRVCLTSNIGGYNNDIERTKNSAIRAYEMMKEKGYTPEEIETFLAFLNQNAIDSAQPLVQRMDFLELLLYGIAVLVVVAPELSRRLSNRFLGTS